jgi:hypothetical protein
VKHLEEDINRLRSKKKKPKIKEVIIEKFIDRPVEYLYPNYCRRIVDRPV